MRVFVFICLLALTLNSCKEENNPENVSNNFELVRLGDGVYSCIHKFGGKAICNVGIVDNGNETIVFDSFLSPEVAGELLSRIEELGLSPVKYVINSHFHNDHIRGNQMFPAEARIISTLRTKEIIEEDEPLQIAYEKENAPGRFSHYDSLYQTFEGDKKSRKFQQILMWRPYYETLSKSHLEVQTRLPDLFVDSIHSLKGPIRNIQLISRGEGHTESDLVLYLPDDDILFTGDLVFNKCHPYIPHGNISKWKAWLDFMNSLSVKTVMPGHGQLGNSELIDQMKNYLVDIENRALKLVNEKTPIEEIDSISVPQPYKEWWFDRFYSYNLKFAYELLEPSKLE